MRGLERQGDADSEDSVWRLLKPYPPSQLILGKLEIGCVSKPTLSRGTVMTSRPISSWYASHFR
jgi:hypothetical protein